MAKGNDAGIADKDRQRHDHDHANQRLSQESFEFAVPDPMHDDAKENDNRNEAYRGKKWHHRTRDQMRSPVVRGENRPCGRKNRTRITSAYRNASRDGCSPTGNSACSKVEATPSVNPPSTAPNRLPMP